LSQATHAHASRRIQKSLQLSEASLYALLGLPSRHDAHKHRSALEGLLLLFDHRVLLSKNIGSEKQKRQVNPALFMYSDVLSTCVLKSLLELVNTSAHVNELLLAGEEGVALGANFYADLSALGGLGRNGLAACATDYTLFVIGMNSGFHVFYLVSNIPMFFDIVCKRSNYITYFSRLQELFENFFIFFKNPPRFRPSDGQ
jgi:hypothetical protein